MQHFQRVSDKLYVPILTSLVISTWLATPHAISREVFFVILIASALFILTGSAGGFVSQ
jgi:hypothetical protein